MVFARLLPCFTGAICCLAGLRAQHADLPIDPQATVQTVQLYRNLKAVSQKNFLFGHQDDLAYGVGWKYQPGASDVLKACGDYPAVYGWELGHLELGASVNLDSVPFDQMRGFIQTGYARGGIITLSWHLNNPLTGKSAWDPAVGTVDSVLVPGRIQDRYLGGLDRVADFLESLRSPDGTLIPVIFRPFHECNGNWFWWGASHCTPLQLQALYRLTVAYLRDRRGLHHLLYAYNTDRFSSAHEYLERYPGDSWVDLMGLDVYQGHGIATREGFIRDVQKMLSILGPLADGHQKLYALTEFGNNGLADSLWWTQGLIPSLQGYHPAYALAWRNAGIKSDGSQEFYVPFPGQTSAPDFARMRQGGRCLFGSALKALRIYEGP